MESRIGFRKTDGWDYSGETLQPWQRCYRDPKCCDDNSYNRDGQGVHGPRLLPGHD